MKEHRLQFIWTILKEIDLAGSQFEVFKASLIKSFDDLQSRWNKTMIKALKEYMGLSYKILYKVETKMIYPENL